MTLEQEVERLKARLAEQTAAGFAWGQWMVHGDAESIERVKAMVLSLNGIRLSLPSAILNTLPDNVRLYIHHLEADADPAGELERNWHLTQENAALRVLLAEWQWFINLPPGTRVRANEDGPPYFAVGSTGTVLTHSKDGCTLVAFDDPLMLDEGNKTKPAGAWWASTDKLEALE